MLGAYARDVGTSDAGGAPSKRSAGPAVGIFGGTFDPVHVGHLVAATWAREALGLDRVLLVVANVPWQKAGTRAVTAAEDRFRMVQAAVEGWPARGQPHGDRPRRAQLHRRHGARAARGATPSAASLCDRGRRCGRRARHLAARRRAARVRSPWSWWTGAAWARAEDPPGWRVERLRIPALDISSSELRERLAEGRSVDFLIPEPAIRCIRQLNLYAGTR